MFKSFFVSFYDTTPRPKSKRDGIQCMDPAKDIPGLLTYPEETYSTEAWLRKLTDSSLPDESKRLVDLESCIVQSLDQFRGNYGPYKSDMHENVALRFAFASNGFRDDSRAICIHRTPKDPAGGLDRYSRTPSSVLLTPNTISCRSGRFCEKLSTSLGPDSSTDDLVTISTNYESLKLHPHQNTYRLARSFDLMPEARFTALDAAILASCLTASTANHSKLAKNCMWFATLYFLVVDCIVRERGYPSTIRRGPAFDEAGKVGCLQFIDQTTGRLFFHEPNYSVDTALASMKQAMGAKGESSLEIQAYEQIIRTEWEDRSADRYVAPLSALVTLFNATRTKVHHEIKRTMMLHGMKECQCEEEKKAASEKEETERKRAFKEQCKERAEERFRKMEAVVDREKAVWAGESEAQMAGKVGTEDEVPGTFQAAVDKEVAAKIKIALCRQAMAFEEQMAAFEERTAAFEERTAASEERTAALKTSLKHAEEEIKRLEEDSQSRFAQESAHWGMQALLLGRGRSADGVEGTALELVEERVKEG